MASNLPPRSDSAKREKPVIVQEINQGPTFRGRTLSKSSDKHVPNNTLDSKSPDESPFVSMGQIKTQMNYHINKCQEIFIRNEEEKGQTRGDQQTTGDLNTRRTVQQDPPYADINSGYKEEAANSKIVGGPEESEHQYQAMNYYFVPPTSYQIWAGNPNHQESNGMSLNSFRSQEHEVCFNPA